MQVRSFVTASLMHGALIVGVALGVHPWLAENPTRLKVAIRPQEAVIAVPQELELTEEVEPVETPEPDLVDPPPLPPVPLPPPTQPKENAPADDPIDPVYQETRLLPPIREILTLVRRKPVPVEEPPVSATMPSPAQAYVEARALDEYNKPPEFPALAARLQIEGDVVLLVTVGVDGHVTLVDILETSGVTRVHKQFQTAAIAAICRWRYAPATRDGKPVEAKIRMPVQFRLRPDDPKKTTRD